MLESTINKGKNKEYSSPGGTTIKLDTYSDVSVFFYVIARKVVMIMIKSILYSKGSLQKQGSLPMPPIL
ncbi:hypothetical protein C1637_09495 [Chryseobacterium lactis]|uniref:Uncharacterized protein n=1 Tax=Chryseobacterium lactis TaxID=1241981 RepID=A0A3G6RLB1_CHRLC|nr:hypothetical protein EG342_10210 [Chryseobacterium lactis]AZB02636.1 hypothetical protein EG341_01070 [Chryseobacterium lactis]PNW14071.1 hypothetical protein C1637_09495 [Chryseobacterium lactis]